MNKINWIHFMEQIGAEPAGGQAPTSSPGQGAAPPGNPPGPTPDNGPNDPNMAQQQPQDIPDASTDPQVPDMPQQEPAGDMDFEQWKNQYFRESIKGDPQILIDLIKQVQYRPGLHELQEKFLSDNLDIQFLRQDNNILEASKEVRKLLRQDLDQNNPSVSIVNHLSEVLQKFPDLNNTFIRLAGMGGLKGECHRKYIAALLGAVQVSGGGANAEDLVYNERTYSLQISTRMNSSWGNISIGNWSLNADDPSSYLEPAEQRSLQEGAPDLKEALRLQVIMESISSQFKKRAMICNVVGTDGTIYTLGFDVGGSLLAAYTEGKLVCKTKQVNGSPAMITPDGQIVPFMDVKLYYSKENGQVDEDGKPDHEMLNFMSWEHGMLFLTGQLDTIREAAGAFQGIVLKETPYAGNPSDIKILLRCHPSTKELILRDC